MEVKPLTAEKSIKLIHDQQHLRYVSCSKIHSDRDFEIDSNSPAHLDKAGELTAKEEREEEEEEDEKVER